MGFLFLFVAVWVIWRWIDAIITVFKTICDVIFWGILNIYRYFKVDKPMKQRGFLQQKELEKKLVEAENVQKHREQIMNQQNRIIQASLGATRELRVKYPYADEFLFQMFLKKFNTYSMEEVKAMENTIRKSHTENELKMSLELKPQIQYTLEDINGLTPMEERREDPLVMKIYKIGTDYVLYVNNLDNNVLYLAQSKDYFVTARMIIKIIEAQNKLKVQKGTIKAEDLDKIYSEVNDSVANFRRNRMGFLE